MPHDFTSIWNLNNKKQKQTYPDRVQAAGCQRGRKVKGSMGHRFAVRTNKLQESRPSAGNRVSGTGTVLCGADGSYADGEHGILCRDVESICCTR